MMSGEPGAADPQIQVEVASDQLGAWVTENRTLDPDGDHVKYLPGVGRGLRAGAPGGSRHRGRVLRPGSPTRATGNEVEYHPASRFWPLQWRETGLLLGLAALLTGFCFWRIRRDLT